MIQFQEVQKILMRKLNARPDIFKIQGKIKLLVTKKLEYIFPNTHLARKNHKVENRVA